MLIVDGPIQEVATFGGPPTGTSPTYSLTVVLGSPIAPGTAWTVQVGPHSYTSVNGTLVVPGLDSGTYPFTVETAYAPDGTTRYLPVDDPSLLALNSNQTVGIGFFTQYWVDLENGTGGSLTVTAASGALEAPSGWFDSGTELVITATSGTPCTSFLGWRGTGTGAYTGGQTVAVLTVEAPITEVAQFGPSCWEVMGPLYGTPLLTMPELWVVTAIAGLALGGMIGIAARRASRAR
jgi:hypothetical protein